MHATGPACKVAGAVCGMCRSSLRGWGCSLHTLCVVDSMTETSQPPSAGARSVAAACDTHQDVYCRFCGDTATRPILPIDSRSESLHAQYCTDAFRIVSFAGYTCLRLHLQAALALLLQCSTPNGINRRPVQQRRPMLFVTSGQKLAQPLALLGTARRPLGPTRHRLLAGAKLPAVYRAVCDLASH